jgi:hypothetical protein
MANKVAQQPTATEDVEDLNEYRRLVLYVYLVAYTAKYYLNGQEDAELFSLSLRSVIHQFSTIFEDWATTNSESLLIIRPQKLNTCFKTLVTK